jgi:hypothetical protein
MPVLAPMAAVRSAPAMSTVWQRRRQRSKGRREPPANEEKTTLRTETMEKEEQTATWRMSVA